MTPGQERLKTILEECLLEVAEIERDVEEGEEKTRQRIDGLRKHFRTVWRLGDLGEPPEYRVEREVRKHAG